MRAPEFWRAETAGGAFLSTLLAPLGRLYGYSVRLRRVRTHPYRAKARNVCVGNLTVGGTGKTPVALEIGRRLIARGARVVFLSRGYGGRLKGPVEVNPLDHTAADVGDEPLLLAACAPTVVARDRKLGAQLCDSMGADVIVMDDGHQNFQIAKDLSLVVVSAKEGFGNGKILPAGPLREPVAQGLARADAVIVMGDGGARIPDFGGEILRARAYPRTPDALRGQTVFAFAGIADPDRFFNFVDMRGAKVLGRQIFADHHPFTKLEISMLRLAAEKLGARLVTTEKDYVRIEPHWREGILPIPLSARFSDSDAIERLLDRVCPRGNKADA